MLCVGQLELSVLQEASVASCFGWARLHPAPCLFLWRHIRLNWSCNVLVESPHKTSQRGFLPHFQPEGSVQKDTFYPSAPRKKASGQITWVGSLDGLTPEIS